QALEWIASKNINLISVFSKVKICYQTMSLELVADFANCSLTEEQFAKEMGDAFEKLNGIFTVKRFEELK
ncbi:MAG: ACT domain protein, partial [Candidatus Methanomethylophilus sp.]|nr:ACT domain protein [Methanomethylophilus sp.]